MQVKRRANKFTKSARFQQWCTDAFEAMDLDESGALDKTEVYCGILKLYTQIIAYIPTAVPPTKGARAADGLHALPLLFTLSRAAADWYNVLGCCSNGRQDDL